MNKAVIESRQRVNDALARELIIRTNTIKTASDRQQVKLDLERWQSEETALKSARARLAGMATLGNGGTSADALDAGTDTAQTHAVDNGKRLSFGLKSAQNFARQIDTKALASSGAAVVPQEFAPNPVALGKPALSLLDVLPTIPHASSQYAYLRQTTRTNNAAVVVDNGTKPTSVYTVTQIEQALSIVAHLSEGVPRYWLADNAALEGFLRNELTFGLQRAVEAKVLADINTTSGIGSQTYATSIPVTLRKAMTALETNGYTAGAIVLHPSDFETIELALSTTNAVEHLGLPYDAATRRLYGVPVAATVSQTAGVGHVIANGAVAIDTDTLGVQLTWSETSNADDWSKNLIRARCEGRYGTSVYQPLGVVTAALASS